MGKQARLKELQRIWRKMGVRDPHAMAKMQLAQEAKNRREPTPKRQIDPRD